MSPASASLIALAKAFAGVVLAVALLSMPLPVHSQPATPKRIGFIMHTPADSPPSRGATAAFRQALRDLGYEEGRNLVVDYRYAETGSGQIPEHVADLVRSRVSVIVTGSSDVTRIAQKATRTIPIVMAVSASPVEQGFVASMARPGGNITGMSMFAPEVAGKRLELLAGMVRKGALVAVLRSPPDPAMELQWQSVEAMAGRLGLRLLSLEALGASSGYETLFEAAVKAKADAVLPLAHPAFVSHAPQISQLAIRHRLPIMFFERSAVAAGGLASYGPSIVDLFRRSASYVDKILKGANPADLPVEQPATFELSLNLATARAIGITLPPDLVTRADVLIRAERR